MKRKLSLTLAIILASATFAMGASPAQAVGPTLPSNQHLFSLDCSGFLFTVWSLDSETGNATRVGTETPGDFACPYNAQENPVDGTVFVLTTGMGGLKLRTVDPTTGVYSTVGVVSGDCNDAFNIVITNTGDAFASGNGKFCYLDLVSAVTTLLGNHSAGEAVTAMGYNPADDTIYIFGTSGHAFTVNKSTGAATRNAQHDVVVSYTVPQGTSGISAVVYGVTFDSSGNLWVSNLGYDSEILVENFATGETTYKGQMNDHAHALYSNAPFYDYFAYAIFVTTDPTVPSTDSASSELPDTGIASDATGVTVATSFALLIAGVVATFVARRRRVLG